jgi:hypothetical protein
MFFSRPIQWHHSHVDPIWPDGTFNVWLFIGNALTLSYSSKINGYLEGLSTLDKKRPDTGMLSEGNAAHPVGRDSPL